MSTVIPEGSVTFAITVDSGELERQGKLLVNSIRRTYPEAHIVGFIPEDSAPDVTEESSEYFEAETTLVTGEIPIPEYPISALLKAFVEAEKRSDNQFLIAMDTDTVVVNRLQIPNDSGTDLYLRPAEVGAQYWCSAASKSDWKQLYDHFGLTEPLPDEYRLASVDKRPIPPYWNSGVVVTTDHSLPAEWLEITKELLYNTDLPVSSDEFFIDQISLALASRTRSVTDLTETQNYPLGGRIRCPQDVEIIHYGDTRNLSRILEPSIRTQLTELGAPMSAPPSALIRSCLDVASTQSGRVLSFDQKQTLRRLAYRILPRRILEK